MIITHLSELWIATFFTLCGAIFLASWIPLSIVTARGNENESEAEKIDCGGIRLMLLRGRPWIESYRSDMTMDANCSMAGSSWQSGKLDADRSTNRNSTLVAGVSESVLPVVTSSSDCPDCATRLETAKGTKREYSLPWCIFKGSVIWQWVEQECDNVSRARQETADAAQNLLRWWLLGFRQRRFF